MSYKTRPTGDFLKTGKSPEIEGLFSGQFLSFLYRIFALNIENTNNSYSVNFYPGIYLNTK